MFIIIYPKYLYKIWIKKKFQKYMYAISVSDLKQLNNIFRMFNYAKNTARTANTAHDQLFHSIHIYLCVR